MDSERIRIPYPVIVEGRYDRLRLSSVIDAEIITTDGFGIFKNAEKKALLAALAAKTPLIVLTDPDAINVPLTWDVTQIVNSWYENVNYGLVLQPAASGFSGCAGFFSNNYGTGSVKPSLCITYTDVRGVEDCRSYTSQDAGFAGQAFVDNATGNLVVSIPTLTTADALCALQNAMDQLVLGSTQLTEALRQITQGQSSLESGIAAFKTQATTLNEATGTLAEGADALATGIGGAETGADELEGYAQSATDLSAGAVSSMGTAAEQLSSVAEQLGQAGTAVELAIRVVHRGFIKIVVAE